MIDISKTVSEYTDDEIKSLRSDFKGYCSGSPREFTVYKVFIQGFKEMRAKSPNSHIRDVPGYVNANAENFPIQGDVTAFCERMATAISDMVAANGGADIEQVADDDCTEQRLREAVFQLKSRRDTVTTFVPVGRSAGEMQ